MNYDLNRLNGVTFQEMIQALILNIYKPLNVFCTPSRGRDGQKDLCFYVPSTSDAHDEKMPSGNAIGNCKFRCPGTKEDGWKWLRPKVIAELNGYKNKKASNPASWPETLVFYVNIPITDNVKTEFEKLLSNSEYCKLFSHIIVRGTDDIRGMLNNNINVAISCGVTDGLYFINVPSDAPLQDSHTSTELINGVCYSNNDEYCMPNELKDKGKDTISGLTEGNHISWIVGAHGMGKTSYMMELIRKERYEPNPRYKGIVWVEYHENLNKSIDASLSAGLNECQNKATNLKLDDINNELFLVFIDNADESIANELRQKKFRSVVSLCSYSRNPTVLLSANTNLAKDVFCSRIPRSAQNDSESINGIVEKTQGHPGISSLLGQQADRFLTNNTDERKTLSDYYILLKKEGFNLKLDDKESIAENIKTRFEADYNALDDESKRVLNCFCLLDNADYRLSPHEIGWHSDRPELFEELSDWGFLECDVRSGRNEYYMHEIMREAVKKLCGKIGYDSIRGFVKVIGTYIDRDNVHGAAMISVYDEVMAAFSLFQSMSGENFDKNHTFEQFEYEPDYAWMVHNIFSAFDDYRDDRAYEGSKYAVKLCESACKNNRLPKIKLARAYNSLGFLPTAYIGKDTLEKLKLASENLHYLQKAAVIVSELKQMNEVYEEFEAKIASNIGAICQRLCREFEDPKNDQQSLMDNLKCFLSNSMDTPWADTYNDILSAKDCKHVLAQLRSVMKQYHQQAYDIRQKMYNAYNDACDSSNKECANAENVDRTIITLKIGLAISTYLLATDNYYCKNYDKSIELHEEARNLYIELQPHIDVMQHIYESYSRCANTCFCKAQTTKQYSDLLRALSYFGEAYHYLNQLADSYRDKATDYYTDFLKAAYDMMNHDPNFSLSFDGTERRLNDVVLTLKTRYKNAIKKSKETEEKKGELILSIDRLSSEAKQNGYYH